MASGWGEPKRRQYYMITGSKLSDDKTVEVAVRMLSECPADQVLVFLGGKVNHVQH